MKRVRPAATALAVFLLASGARAESALRLPEPDVFGDLPAATYDAAGDRVGPATLRLERLPDGHVRLEMQSGIDGAERSQVFAELEPLADGSGLRLVSQGSRSFDATGRPLGHMAIDHAGHDAVCAPPESTAEPARHLALPEPDRVANVPQNLLFLPLVRGETDRITFQLLICSFGPRLIEATARIAKSRAADGHIVEIRYELDIPPFLARFVRPFLPDVAMWFDEGTPGEWIGHRMPLFVRGPTVTVVRSGVSPASLTAGR